ncbi:cytochrome c [Paludisphaera mucosa]|uniref:Cytochrome c n=1 Tax=Paludisphaera mucosa TaxID=3030827 RepID=A0ABT6FI44_9BACT|nr:cytochrome c [Paludisphaera mucosa]MDG3007253.1 cytochrome c [Paludisphaera mucosa]
MKSLICGASLAALIVAAGLSAARVDAAADETASVEVVMKKLFAGKSSPNNTLKAASKTDSPDWTKVKTASEAFSKYAPDLGKNDAPKGDKSSWAKLTKALADESKSLSTAVDKKDVAGFKTAAKNIGGSCKACHDAHKPE